MVMEWFSAKRLMERVRGAGGGWGDNDGHAGASGGGRGGRGVRAERACSPASRLPAAWTEDLPQPEGKDTGGLEANSRLPGGLEEEGVVSQLCAEASEGLHVPGP